MTKRETTERRKHRRVVQPMVPQCMHGSTLCIDSIVHDVAGKPCMRLIRAVPKPTLPSSLEYKLPHPLEAPCASRNVPKSPLSSTH